MGYIFFIKKKLALKQQLKLHDHHVFQQVNPFSRLDNCFHSKRWRCIMTVYNIIKSNKYDE